MRRRLPPLSSLRAFEAAARRGSFTAGAEELLVTHGAISRQIASLEDWLGTPLFDRLGRRVRLTAAGRDYLEAMSRAFDGMAEATRRLTEANAVRSLTVNALPTFSMRWLLPRLAGFQQRHPDVALRLVTSDRPLDEVREPFDVAIRRGPDTWSGCMAAPFLAEWEVPVMSPVLAERQPVRQSVDLAHHTLLHADTRPGAWQRWLSAAGQQGLAVAGNQRFDHFYLTLQAAADGLGVALGPLPILADELAAGRLVAPLDGPKLEARGYWRVTPNGRADDAAVQALSAWLDAEGQAMGAPDPSDPDA
ncbi:DNA-binding transcriptional activator GcvA [Aliidongia dinghuensis]|uniref:DNA-binding transcriptional activator GcvA n=1 Tax=Aliidongia dinghuensis TaxID=1867774 RepID=A0A8J2YY07_9PROT|nr:transcriptional regulator GcvA [Aliidongia dinghuensis]GGF35306.1 DNA-binding transcriptional activator GcvA [Aliidongia dinghuensis]